MSAELTAEFSRRGARVMRSPYWYVYGADQEARSSERGVLLEGLHTAGAYDDLTGAAKAIFDRAEAAADAELPTALPGESMQDYYERRRVSDFDMDFVPAGGGD